MPARGLAWRSASGSRPCWAERLDFEVSLARVRSFTLTLPHIGYRHPTAEELSALQAEAMSVSSADVKGKVLVVDDVALNLKVMSVMLSRAHIPFVAVGSAGKRSPRLNASRSRPF